MQYTNMGGKKKLLDTFSDWNAAGTSNEQFSSLAILFGKDMQTLSSKIDVLLQ